MEEKSTLQLLSSISTLAFPKQCLSTGLVITNQDDWTYWVEQSWFLLYLESIALSMKVKINLSIALYGYHSLKLEIRDSCQIPTTAPIFSQYSYFRQTIWRLASVQFLF